MLCTGCELQRCSEVKICFIVCQISTNAIPPIPVTRLRQSASTSQEHITATVYRASTVSLADHLATVATEMSHVVSYLVSDHSKGIVGGRTIYTLTRHGFNNTSACCQPALPCHQNYTLIRKRLCLFTVYAILCCSFA